MAIEGATPVQLATWAVIGLATAGVILRPFRWPEAVWAVAGAGVLVLTGLLGPRDALLEIGKGLDVYLFLTGMMLLSELARREGLFDWLAALATAQARGSPVRLFTLIYGVGTVVTVFLSNDATAVVLTPAVYAATRAAKVADPLPFLFVCAFIANAASFVLPISNPANLVVFGPDRLPALGAWLATFALPAVVAIVATYAALLATQWSRLASDSVAATVERPALSGCGTIAAAGILLTAALLTGASAFGLELGLPTLAAGLATTLAVLAVKRESPLPVLRGLSWDVLPLVAGLFVLVEALDRTGVIRHLAETLASAARDAPTATAGLAGLIAAFGSNLVNNLPAGLLAGTAVAAAETPRSVVASLLIGIDLGPNLSVTGSLATILWLSALRREGLHVGTWQFLKLGLVVMPPALVLSLAALLLRT